MKITHGPQPHQVLQRAPHAATVRVSGVTESSSPIIVQLLDSDGPVRGFSSPQVQPDRNLEFTTEISVPTGGPYTLVFSQEEDTAEIAPLYCGDVWILAGQSNMEGIGNMSHPAEPHPLVKAFSMARVWRSAEDPLHILPESPDRCHNMGNPISGEAAEKTRKNKPAGVGVGVHFGREMVTRNGLPHGLICTAHGGTSMAQWSPERTPLGEESLYWSMLESVRQTGQPVAGVLWYQGESDANEKDVPFYTERMQQLVASTREDLKQPDLPWIIVQIGKFFGNRTPAEIRNWNLVQDQQRRLPESIEHLYTIAAIDLPMDDAIHISSLGFPTLARRMAAIAGTLISPGVPLIPPPQLNSIRKLDNSGNAWQFAIEYSHVESLTALGYPNGYALTDESGREQPLIIKTTLEGRKAIIEVAPPTGKLPETLQLHYGFGCTPYCNITDERGLALPVFGPLPLGPKSASTPYIRNWKVSSPQQLRASENEIPSPPAGLVLEKKTYDEDGFVNEHENWVGQTGFAYFFQRFTLKEPMKLCFKIGYDGPFASWIDGKSLHLDPFGANPCIPDKSNCRTDLEAGEHEICIGMDVGNGIAWGFFLRVIREDISQEDIDSGNYALPLFD